MANYPSLPWSEKSRFTPRSGLLHDTADDGTIRTRDTYAATNYELVLVHEFLTASERSTLLSHFAAHRVLTFDCVAPFGETYSVRYLDEPDGEAHPAGHWTMTSRLTGTKV